MAFKYRQKKTIRRKRRFLKRKGAKTYRRSLTKRRSMRGGENIVVWLVDLFISNSHDPAISNVKFEFNSTDKRNLDIANHITGKLLVNDNHNTSNCTFDCIAENYYPPNWMNIYIVGREVLHHFRKHPVDESWKKNFDTNPDEFIDGYLPK